ncbi:bacteriocin maturation protein [Cohnella zeiphila]|uniref:Bacteriocin maturation protein n=1 Tax=Cohnella zeiphila TaxID=2761120 RepID=A0A7X0VWJ9_9BACL|nr:bacteriocin maturation protein [Cohnella zeiphila]MBB6732580.1 bacteriocin maturation protein [Cohnella zeiphila]
MESREYGMGVTAGAARVLLVGTGPLLASLAAALDASGFADVQVRLTASSSGEAEPSWRESLGWAQWVWFGSCEEDREELLMLEEECRRAGKPLLPALIVRGTGMAGPLGDPSSGAGWEAVRRRVHRTALSEGGAPRADSFAEAMLANVLVSEWLKEVAEGGRSTLRDHVYLLDLETLEGRCHPFASPASGGRRFSPQPLEPGLLLQPASGDEEERDLFVVFGRLTSPVSGIFRLWDEGDLSQLPLSQCRVQTIDPLSEGFAELMPLAACAGLTHREARREAGLAGIESYTARLASSAELVSQPAEWTGIGAGGTVPEAFNRALRNGLARYMEKKKQPASRPSQIREWKIGAVRDAHCRFYGQTLAVMGGTPAVFEREDCLGFPSIWVRAGSRWYGGTGLNRTLALRMALQRAIQDAQLRGAGTVTAECETTPADGEGDEDEVPLLDVEETEEMNSVRLTASALRILDANRVRLSIFDLAAEPFLKEEFGAVLGLLLEEGTE